MSFGANIGNFHPNLKELKLEIIYALSNGGQQGGGIAAFLPFILIMFIIYFLMIRPQTKRQKEKQNMIQSLQKGDKVITIGGVHGSVVGFKQKGTILILKVGKNMDIAVNRSAVAGLEKNVAPDEITTIEEKA
ncbi:uncharacterized protein METZ01_LOCUS116434 [marine metagenome]|uniref:Preprotein translocase subunit YajC n=1 Tax=marine metagenome TaxID=408172 RepID=A0A381XG29_9ZZZZ